MKDDFLAVWSAGGIMREIEGDFEREVVPRRRGGVS